MNYKKIKILIIGFMKVKQKNIVRQTIPGAPIKYFDKIDAAAIMQFSDKEIDWIIDKFFVRAANGIYNNSHIADICPFCIVRICETCEYAANHGMCEEKDSDLDKLYKHHKTDLIHALCPEKGETERHLRFIVKYHDKAITDPHHFYC